MRVHDDPLTCEEIINLEDTANDSKSPSACKRKVSQMHNAIPPHYDKTGAGTITLFVVGTLTMDET